MSNRKLADSLSSNQNYKVFASTESSFPEPPPRRQQTENYKTIIMVVIRNVLLEFGLYGPPGIRPGGTNVSEVNEKLKGTGDGNWACHAL